MTLPFTVLLKSKFLILGLKQNLHSFHDPYINLTHEGKKSILPMISNEL
jgi:hypothetical protein